MKLNTQMVNTHGSGKFAIAFHPLYISKSGNETPGAGYFWCGCALKAKYGLEIGGIAAVDLEHHTAFHIEAVQSLNPTELKQIHDKINNRPRKRLNFETPIERMNQILFNQELHL